MNESQPSPTAKIYLGFAERYRARHPGVQSIPEKLLNDWWLRAAAKTNNNQLTNILEAEKIAKTKL